MLAQLTISNFAIVRELEIDFHSGMTAITGKPAPGNPLPSTRWGCASAAERKPTWCVAAPPVPTCARFALKDTPCRPALAGRESAGERA